MKYTAVMSHEKPPRHVSVDGADRIPLIGERVILCDPSPEDPSVYPGTVYEVERLTHFASSEDADMVPGKKYRTARVLVHLRRLEMDEDGPLYQLANADA